MTGKIRASGNIRYVVNQYLCCSCGTCVKVCPSNAISMIETPGGLLQAEVCENLCNYCGMCRKVCPGDHLQAGLLSQEIDPFKGPLRKAYYGKATNVKHLAKGQSGGIATTLLCYLLEQKYIDKALVTEMPSDGSLRPIGVWAENEEEVVRSQGSKYCPVALNASLPEGTKKTESRYAVVGLPCHIHGLENMLEIRNAASRPLLIGLVCDRVMSYGALDYLVNKANLEQTEVRSLQFRDKMLGGWPGDTGIKTTADEICRLSSKHRMWCKSFFTPLRCYLCFDKMNYFADIVLGDAWGVQEAKEGCSIILARTSRGQDVIEKAILSKVVDGEEINSDSVFKGQCSELKRKNWTLFTTVWKQQGNNVPNFGIISKWHSSIIKGETKLFWKNIRISRDLAHVRSRTYMLKKANLKYSLGQIKRRILSLF